MENINPSYWGNKFWMTFYSIIAVYPHDPSEEVITNTMIFFETFRYLLPCASCRESYTKFTSEENTDIKNKENFKNRNNLTKMIFNLRKKVESKVGLEYCSTVAYLTFKMNNMICKDKDNNLSKYEYNANNVHECAFIPERLENKAFDYIKKNESFIKDYNRKNTKNMISKLKAFLQNPDIISNQYQLWIDRNIKCSNLINEIEKNMCEQNYNFEESFRNDKQLHVQLLYLGSTIIPYDDLAYLLNE